MWRIADYTHGRIRTVLVAEWGIEAANAVLERNHHFGAATDIAHELTFLGFERSKDFDLRPARPLAPVSL